MSDATPATGKTNDTFYCSACRISQRFIEVLRLRLSTDQPQSPGAHYPRMVQCANGACKALYAWKDGAWYSSEIFEDFDADDALSGTASPAVRRRFGRGLP